jgi:hypothetical protein
LPFTASITDIRHIHLTAHARTFSTASAASCMSFSLSVG